MPKYEDDFPGDEEDDDEDTEEEEEESVKPIKKAKRIKKKKDNDIDWELYSQPAFNGYRSKDTNEVITTEEAIKKLLNNTEEILRGI